MEFQVRIAWAVLLADPHKEKFASFSEAKKYWIKNITSPQLYADRIYLERWSPDKRKWETLFFTRLTKQWVTENNSERIYTQ